MKIYTHQNHSSTKGLILLGIGAIIIGIAGGVIASLISNFIYYLVVFSFVVGFLVGNVYLRWVRVTRIRNSYITAAFGLVLGLCIAYGFYGLPFWIERQQAIDQIKQEYQVDYISAAIGLDDYLFDETGSRGLLAYMKLRATQGDEYSSTITVNSMPVKTSSFVMKSTLSWLYWLLETLGFTLPTVILGFGFGKRPYNASVNDWYETSSTQIGSARTSDLEILKIYISTNDFNGIHKLLVPEEEISHPMLELCRQVSKGNKGDVLISLLQTERINQRTVKRTKVAQWEATPEELEDLEGRSGLSAENTNTSDNV